MASLNLSANGPSISKSYQSVVDFALSANAERASALAKWALFSVSTPLLSAFQQDAGNKESVLKVQDTGEGELADLLDEFSEGKVQFAFVKVVDANTGLPKSVLIAWCGEGVPERTKGYFTSHLAAVSKFLHGYHVQITARSDADLTVEGIIQKVGDASGSKYTPATDKPTGSVPNPPVANKPVFTPLRTGNVSAGAAVAAPLPVRTKANDDDGWGPDAPPVTRTNLEKVKPAYQPTRVNMQELRSGKQAEPIMNQNSTPADQDGDVVKGGYQPIGKVDIGAIRRQAREAGDVKDDRPEPVKGAYEPVGKVDIAAIRARAQKTDEPIANAKQNTAAFDGRPDPEDHDSDKSNRLTSLPKPKVSNKFGGSSTFMGTKPPLPGASAPSATPVPPVGSASRTFADQGGKTPAQLWAEKKAKERGQESTPAVAPTTAGTSTIQSQPSGGGEWKSSYSGKTWAPVQTTHTGRSNESGRNDTTDSPSASAAIAQPEITQQSVGTMLDQLTQGSSNDPPGSAETRGLASSAETPSEIPLEASHEPEPSQSSVPQPGRVQSRETEVSERESSPIRVAMPVARGAADDNEENHPISTNEHADTGSPDDKNQFQGAQAASSLPAEITPAATPAIDAGGEDIRALVQYDYDKAEDNEIDLKEGEYVTDIEMVDQDWWLGLNARGEKGLFPSNYVEVIEDGSSARPESENPPAEDYAPAAVAAHTSTEEPRGKPTAKALYDYDAAEDNELSFPEGAEITNIGFPDDDWWLGEYHGKTGLFPANYVQLDE